MGIFKYSKDEEEINKVLKLNQKISGEVKREMDEVASMADNAIAESEALLHSLGMGQQVTQAKQQAKARADAMTFDRHQPKIKSWDELVKEANQQFPEPVELEDLLTRSEIDSAFREADEINAEFSSRTGICNKTDLSFLAIATALQTTKALLIPLIAGKIEPFLDKENRLAHDDKQIKATVRKRQENFTKHHEKKSSNWVEIATRPVPYDITAGSKAAFGKGFNGNDHRLYTLGHDPVLGWIFGTANILTDTMTLNTFQTYRISRNPMVITPVQVDPITLFQEVVKMIQADKMNLPAAIFAQAVHLESDAFTKCGLPVPLLSTIDESFALDLYQQNFDALDLAGRMTSAKCSVVISLITDCMISLLHGLFYDSSKEKNRRLYEVRTRKILLLSNTIASSSSVIATCITQNPKQLDIGGLLVTVGHLFTDLRFIAKVKQEFVQNEIDKKMQAVLDDVDSMYNSMI